MISCSHWGLFPARPNWGPREIEHVLDMGFVILSYDAQYLHGSPTGLNEWARLNYNNYK